MGKQSSIVLDSIVKNLEKRAPLSLQESYDNSGLVYGTPTKKIDRLLLSLDCTKETLIEAKEQECDMLITHHPLLFKPLKKIDSSNPISKSLIYAIKHDIAIYSIHTNLDNVKWGVNKILCDKIGLKNTKILSSKELTLYKLVVFVPLDHKDRLLESLYKEGAGSIGNYSNCSFQIEGKGTFMPKEEANPYIGSALNLQETKETRIEVIVPVYNLQLVLKAMRNNHPYEEVAYYLQNLLNENQDIGSGMTGYLDAPVEFDDFLDLLKKRLNLSSMRYSKPKYRSMQKISVCGGAGNFLIAKAINNGSQVYITSDCRYHEFIEARDSINLIDIGHYESEVLTLQLLEEWLSADFPNVEIKLAKEPGNPVSYY